MHIKMNNYKISNSLDLFDIIIENSKDKNINEQIRIYSILSR